MPERPLPRLALSREEAAAALGMSLNSFVRHVAPEVAVIRLGRMRLYPLNALQRWAERNAERNRSFADS